MPISLGEVLRFVCLGGGFLSVSWVFLFVFNCSLSYFF